MSVWPNPTVAELQSDGVLLVEDGNHGEYRPRPDEFVDRGTAFIRATDLADGQVMFADAGGINEVAVARIRKGIGRPGDIIFSHKGTVGKLARVPLNAQPFVCSPQTTFWRILDESRLRRNYLYAFMRSKAFINQWWVRKGETDMADYVSLTAQRQLRIAMPPVEVQERMARPIASLDDLIDNNRRRIQVLDEMARTIYREWFVHFRFPGYKDRDLVKSVGMVPDGWKVCDIGDVLELRYGKALKAEARRGGPVAVVGSSGIVGWHDEPLVSGPVVVVGRKGNVGAVTWITSSAWPIDTTYYVESELPLPFVYEQLTRTKFVNSHAAVPGLSREDAYSQPFLVPERDVTDRYADLWETLKDERYDLEKAAATTTRIRQLLLPKLLSGQIDVSALSSDAAVEVTG